MENEGESASSVEKSGSSDEFERQLKEILRRYNVQAPGFEAEVVRIHKEYSQKQE